MKARLTQELQQTRHTHNVLQADLDKVGGWLTPLSPRPCVFCATADLLMPPEKNCPNRACLPYRRRDQTESFWAWVLSFTEGGEGVRISDLKVWGGV